MKTIGATTQHFAAAILRTLSNNDGWMDAWMDGWNDGWMVFFTLKEKE